MVGGREAQARQADLLRRRLSREAHLHCHAASPTLHVSGAFSHARISLHLAELWS